MWYPPQQQQQQQQQQQCWHGYIHHLSPTHQQKRQQHQQSYSRTSYYCNTDETLSTNQATTYVVPRHDENESLIHYHPTRVDDVYATGSDYYVTNSTGSYSDEMSSSSSLSYQTSNTHWNPVISAPTKPSIVTNSIQQNVDHSIKPSSSPSSSSSACWDWLLYPPEIYSHLYIPSSSFIQQHQQQQDDDFDLLASLPTWLLALLYPSMKQRQLTDDENDSDQEISSLNNNHNHDEPLLSMNIEKKINHVSSNLSLSSDNSLNGQKIQQNRSSTPDTDDGYQSASDASRSDYSQQSSSLHYDHHNSKDDITINVPSLLIPKRISYAAAVKPMTTPINNNNNKISPSATPIIKTKNNSSLLITNDLLNNNGQKSKFIAPRFERMHHAKQYSSTTTTTVNKDSSSSSSSSSTSLTNRVQVRSNNNNHHHQRNHIINSSRRR